MQRMHDRGSIKAIEVPWGSRTLAVLIEKGWVESCGDGRDKVFRITEQGIVAKKARIPSRRKGLDAPCASSMTSTGDGVAQRDEILLRPLTETLHKA